MTDHRAEALALIDNAARTVHEVNDSDTPVVEFIGALQVAGVSAAIASAKALVHLGDQLRLANLLAAAAPPDIDWPIRQDVHELIRREIQRLVNNELEEVPDAQRPDVA